MSGVPGSRLYFILAAMHAAISIPLWLWLRDSAALGTTGFAGGLWHGHEMIFGYVPAVMAGFLTLGSRGSANVICASIWIFARVAMLLGWADAWWLLMVIDAAFLPLVVITRRPALWSGFKPFSLVLVALSAGFGALNFNFHLAAHGALDVDPYVALFLGVDLVILLLVVVAGRMIPAYTRAATRRGAGLRLVWSERLSAAVACALLIADGVAPSWSAGACAALLAALQLYRLCRWWDRAVLADPLLWVLHLGFAWLTIGIGLRALALVTGAFSEIDALHAIFVGAIGSLTLGMMARLDLAKRASPLMMWGCVATFVLVSLAAALRAFVGPVLPAAIAAAGATWALAFGCFLLMQLRTVRVGRRSVEGQHTAPHQPSGRA